MHLATGRSAAFMSCADGMGGAAGGEVASRMAVETCWSGVSAENGMPEGEEAA